MGLKVADLERSVRFYRNILGLSGRASGQRVAYVPSGVDLLVLHGKGYGISDVNVLRPKLERRSYVSRQNIFNLLFSGPFSEIL